VTLPGGSPRPASSDRTKPGGSALAFTEEDLFGTWKLVSASSRDVSSGEVSHAFGGPHPVGFICYGKDRRMMAVIAFDNRIKPARVDQTTVEQRDQLFKTMAAYAGTYAVCGDSVQHHIDVSWNETWSGTSVTRDITLQDGKLVLTSRPLLDLDGKTVVLTAVWDRVK
jgi:Lipocalin-like domain